MLTALLLLATLDLPTGWVRNDPERPQPEIVRPGQAVLMPPPSDAVVLFDGSDLSAWQVPEGSDWSVIDGALVPGGKIYNLMPSRRSFGDLQLHVEFREPAPPHGEGQHRGNSGVYLMGIYEIQILDAFDNTTYADGLPGAIYGQYPPLKLAILPPGAWQSFDILFHAPHFDGDRLISPPRVTVLHNGVVVQADQIIKGDTKSNPAAYLTHAERGPIILQDHGTPTDRVAFRNIWVRELDSADGAR